MMQENKLQHPESYCHKCGGHNPIWSADNELFNKVNGSGNGIMCPVCFDKMAREKGIEPFYWATENADASK